MMTQTSLNLVTRELVPDDQRTAITSKLFDMRFALELEPGIFWITERMAEDYRGGYWDFYTLSNGSFYMAPTGDQIYKVICDNFFEGSLSADALGICSCLTAYSHLSFGGGAQAHNYADHYYKLREYSMEHSDIQKILSATD